jgi:hypothetical protein
MFCFVLTKKKKKRRRRQFLGKHSWSENPALAPFFPTVDPLANPKQKVGS